MWVLLFHCMSNPLPDLTRINKENKAESPVGELIVSAKIHFRPPLANLNK